MSMQLPPVVESNPINRLRSYGRLGPAGREEEGLKAAQGNGQSPYKEACKPSMIVWTVIYEGGNMLPLAASLSRPF